MAHVRAAGRSATARALFGYHPTESLDTERLQPLDEPPMVPSPMDELNLDRSSWSIGEAAFEALVTNMREIQPKRILEFGSGASTVRLAMAFPDAEITSVESSPEHFARVLSLVERASISRKPTILFCPLSWRFIGGALYQTYAPLGDPNDLRTFDIVVVDGPPVWTRRGREACLHMVVESLRVGGRVYLDDCRREQEQRIVRNWQTVYGRDAFSVSVIDQGHGIRVLEKRRELHTPKLAPHMVVDSFLVNGDRALRAGWRTIRRFIQTRAARGGSRSPEVE